MAYCDSWAQEWSNLLRPTRDALRDVFGFPEKHWTSGRLDVYLRHVERIAELRARVERDDDPAVEVKRSLKEQDRDRTALATETYLAEQDLAEFHRLTGFPVDLPDPTIPGRTWLCSWPVVSSEETGSRIVTFAALVITPPGMILAEGQQFLVCKAEDLGKDELDIDLASVTLKAIPIRLNRAQCAKWGRPMFWKGRVFWAIFPEEPAAKPKAKTSKHKPA